MSHTKPKKHLGTLSLALISISAIISLRNLPTIAMNGLSSIFFLCLATLFFFMPVALVCAELASGWPTKGGLYDWVKEAFGHRAAAFVIWLEWIGGGVIFLPLVLSFIAATLAYVIYPPLANNRFFLVSVILVALWGGTFLNFLELKNSEFVSSAGMILGTLIPGIAIIGLGIYYFFHQDPLPIHFTQDQLIPDFNLDSLVYLSGVFLSFCGVEIASFYIHYTKNPKRTFARAILIAAVTIVFIYTLGSLAILMVVPKHELLLYAGLMQAIEIFFKALNLPWATPLFAMLSVIGALATLNTWIIGPAKGLFNAALHNDLPAFTKYTNKVGSPVGILLLQASLVSLLACAFLLLPSVSTIYFMFGTLATQFVLIMYFMLFLSVLKLRYTHPHTPRVYKIPGGNWGVWVIAGTGIFSCIITFLLSFRPPAEFHFGNTSTHVLLLICGLCILCSPILYFQYIKKLN